MSDPQGDCEKLLGLAITFAEQMLTENGEFYPFGAAMAPDGELSAVSAYDGQEHPRAEEVIEFLKEALQDGARGGRYIATALAYDARISLPSGGASDAVTVLLDHRDDLSLIVQFPYRREDGAVSFDPPISQNGGSDIFL